MIDTLKYSKQLEGAGLGPKQAELLVRGQIAMITDNVATKADIRDLKELNKELSHRLEVFMEKTDARFESIDARFKSFENVMEFRFDSLESRFDVKIQRMTNRLGVIVVMSVGVLGVFLGTRTV